MTDQIKVQKRATIFILVAVFVSAAGFGIILPALPHLIRELESVSLADATRIGAWIGATYAIFQFLLGPLMGNLGDRFGRRPVFLISLFGFSVDFLLMGLAPDIIWLFIGRGIAGGLGAIFGPANAAMADISTAENRAASFGKVGAAFGLGFIAGPAAGGILGDISTRLPFFVASGMAMAVFLFGYFVFPETMTAERRRKFLWRRSNPVGALVSLARHRVILPVAAIYFLWLTAVNIYPSAWAFFGPAQYGWDAKMVGISLSLTGISMVIIQSFVIGRVVARLGERRTAQLGIVYGILLFAGYSFFTSSMVALTLSLLSGFQGMAMPALNAMMSRRLPPDQQGELQGFNGSLAALSILIAQLCYNNLLSYFTDTGAPVHLPAAPFILAILFAIAGLVALWFLPKAEKAEET